MRSATNKNKYGTFCSDHGTSNNPFHATL